MFFPSEFSYLILPRNLVFPETLCLSVEAGTLNSLLKEPKSSFTQFLSGKLMVRNEISRSDNIILDDQATKKFKVFFDYKVCFGSLAT